MTEEIYYLQGEYEKILNMRVTIYSKASGQHLLDIAIVHVVIKIDFHVELFEDADGQVVRVLLRRAQSTHSAGDTLITLIRSTRAYLYDKATCTV